MTSRVVQGWQWPGAGAAGTEGRVSSAWLSVRCPAVCDPCVPCQSWDSGTGDVCGRASEIFKGHMAAFLFSASPAGHGDAMELVLRRERPGFVPDWCLLVVFYSSTSMGSACALSIPWPCPPSSFHAKSSSQHQTEVLLTKAQSDFTPIPALLSTTLLCSPAALGHAPQHLPRQHPKSPEHRQAPN